METLQKQLSELPQKLLSMPLRTRITVIAGVAAIIGLAVVVSAANAGEGYQYAFTNLSAEDGAEISNVLKSSQIPFRLEAGGTALAVPGNKVYEARLMLATAGLPRGGGTGFELFDRGDLGVSEFTQKVNLRRATEGELARTVSRLDGVRSARVHLTLSERGLFRNEERAAAAAVVLNLQPGRVLNERELAGIRHLVASAVPSLSPNGVTVVDGRGSVLAAEQAWGEEVGSFQRKLERDLEARVIGILEPAVGQGQVVARVTAMVDAAEVSTTADVVDPEATAVRSERTVTQNQAQDSSTKLGTAGAAANSVQQPGSGPSSRSNSNSQEETRNYEVSKTVTKTVIRTPRLQRLSVAILVDGLDGKPRSDAEVARLGELAKRAVGLDQTRGDMINISSAVFSHSSDEAAVAAAELSPIEAIAKNPLFVPGAIGLAVLIAFAMFMLMRGRRAPVLVAEPVALPKVGMTVAQLEAAATVTSDASKNATAAAALEAAGAETKALPDPAIAQRERARELAQMDPARAAHLIRAWLAADAEAHEAR